MGKSTPESEGGIIRNLPRAHDWDLVSTFMLSLAAEMPRMADCMLKPVAETLLPYGITDETLCEISAAIEDAGEDLRGNCPSGALDCITTRLNMSVQSTRHGDKAHPWSYYLIKQMATSESDNLEALEHPTCYIDVYVY